MRGPNKVVKCRCRFCCLMRHRGINARRRKKGLPALPPPEGLPERQVGCPCEACRKNREEVAFAQRLKKWQAA